MNRIKIKPHIRLHVSGYGMHWAQVFWAGKYQYSTKLWYDSVLALKDVKICERLAGNLY